MAKSNKVPKAIGLLQEYFRGKIQDKSLVLKEIESDLFTLMGATGGTIMYDEESGHNASLIPVLRQDKDYWLSLLVSMNGTTSEIGSVSISIYSGSFSDLNKIKLFRAEWGQNSHHLHAQPHWHLHTNDESNWTNKPWNPAEEPMIFVSELKNNVVQKVKKIHFAMAAQWHLNEGSHIVDLKTINDNDVVKWVKSTFEYIIHQLSYLENKSAL
jgi:hypothetical protein